MRPVTPRKQKCHMKRRVVTAHHMGSSDHRDNDNPVKPGILRERWKEDQEQRDHVLGKNHPELYRNKQYHHSVSLRICT